MELDELKTRWEALDAKLDAAIRLNRRVLDERVLGRADRALARGAWLHGVELGLGVLLATLTGSFVAAHVHEARFLVPGLALHLFVIAQIAAQVARIVVARRAGQGAPLVELQRRVESAEIIDLRTLFYTLLVAPLLWPALLVVIPKALAGVDLYAALGAPYLAANAAFGLAVLGAGILVSRRYAGRVRSSPLGLRVLRSLAGRDLAAARRHLASLAAFERDEQA